MAFVALIDDNRLFYSLFHIISVSLTGWGASKSNGTRLRYWVGTLDVALTCLIL